ncbi:RHS repeat-associated core domain-containing protein [Anaeromyxobacter terrae]|uniref:RHS repeat-associated core domain-containing protein n=1 Tax=Anaeromyxobacter terrae TaxID=2925406 RepID=UPI001F596E5D|nr:RHS repeat-associated core domain-containing protein [Anaeromyxobacter sp. SG22]
MEDDGDSCTTDSCDPVKGMLHVAIAGCTVTPPDPSTVASPLSSTSITSFADSVAFLYSGTNRIQFGVAAGAIDLTRIAVARGKALSSEGVPVSGALVTIVGRPQFGHTYTRSDGSYDLVVNGGEQVVAQVAKAGFLPAHARAFARPLDYTPLEDVILLPHDARVTRVAMGISATQVARGSAVDDGAGVRQATVVFPPGTYAGISLPDGTSQQLSTMNVRFTEYTATPYGKKAMPGELPPTSAYTYAIELGADEAVAAGATEVKFNQAVAMYIENYLAFPVGGRVPVGYYDRAKGKWVPSNDGRVVAILGVNAGLAALDVDGSGFEATPTQLSALGITDAERIELAGLYQAGRSLWRVQVTHFTPWDCNWPYGCKDADGDGKPDCAQPNAPPPKEHHDDCNSTQTGSIIECQNQTLGEKVSVVGTPFELYYKSDRASGYKAANTARIPITGAVVPPGLLKIEVELGIAGRSFKYDFVPPFSPDQSFTFEWDGKDAYSRELRGRAALSIRIGYSYDTVYLEPSDRNGPMSFGALSGSGVSFSATRSRGPVTIYQAWNTSLGAWAPRAAGLGGWALSPHHGYDPVGRIVYFGDGKQRRLAELPPIMTTFSGGGTDTGDGIPAGQASLSAPIAVGVAPDGTVYIGDGSRVRRVGQDGLITTVAGIVGTCREAGEGGAAIGACLGAKDVEVEEDGALLVADYHASGGRYVSRIIRITPDGLIHIVAGNGTTGFSGDGGPATLAMIDQPLTAVRGPDGSIFFNEYSCRVRRVDPVGTISTIAGTGVCGSSTFVEGSRAASVSFFARGAQIGVGGDGSVYIPDWDGSMYRTSPYLRVLRVTPEGAVYTFAGNNDDHVTGDGGQARLAGVGWVFSVTVGPDGSVYLGEGDLWLGTGDNLVRRIRPDGVITTLAGKYQGGTTQEGVVATEGALSRPEGLAIGPDGSLYVASSWSKRVKKVALPLPGHVAGNIAVASFSGKDLYVFDAKGRHLRTLDTRTGLASHSFAYDSSGLLASIADVDGNTTRIERDGQGSPVALLAPNGQRTDFVVDADGYLRSVANPAGEATTFAYFPGGLLSTYVDPRQNSHTFGYDTLGRLTSDANPAGGLKNLARSERTDGYTVSLTSAFDATTSLAYVYEVQEAATGDRTNTDTEPDGSQTTTVRTASGSMVTTFADGTVVSTSQAPDPRFGLHAPLAATSMSTPGGLSMTTLQSRSVVLADPNDLLSVTSASSSLTVNGRAFTETYNATTRRLTATTPAGRTARRVFDERGHVVRLEPAGYPALNAITLAYDSSGRVTLVEQGSRTLGIAYDSAGLPSTLTEPSRDPVRLWYDLAGRTRQADLPGNRSVLYGYDANGNMTSIEPPGRTAHVFGFDSVNRLDTYNPPAVPSLDLTPTVYEYGFDDALTATLLPDGSSIAITHERGVTGYSTGRIGSLTTWRGTTSLSYDLAGRLAVLTAPGGEALSKGYDGALLTSEISTGSVSGSVTFGYDTDLRLATVAVDGAPVSNSYDDDGLLTSAGQLSIVRHPATGLATSTSLGVISTAQSYNGYGELESFSAAAGASTLYSYVLVSDTLGRISSKTENIGGVTTAYDYGYDTAGRLSDVTVNGQLVATYLYDANGNRLQKTSAAGVEEGATDAQDRMLSYGSATYTYGPNGDLRTRAVGDEMTAYAYDPFGNLVAVTLPDGTQLDYLVDARNRRIGKKVNGQLVEGFLYQDQLKPIAWLDSSGNIRARFVYGTGVNVPEYMQTVDATYRILTDHLGSPRLVVNTSNGAVAQRLDYDEWGHVTYDSNPGFQPFGFAGGLYDRDTGLVRFGARDYDPQTGRWTNKDPIRFAAGLNLYAYVDNDPANRTDPKGLYGTTSCAPYDARCQQNGHPYYCEIAPMFCEFFPKNEPVSDCMRKCLQDYDKQRDTNVCEDKSNPFKNPDPSFEFNLQWEHESCLASCLADANANPFTHQSQPND